LTERDAPGLEPLRFDLRSRLRVTEVVALGEIASAAMQLARRACCLYALGNDRHTETVGQLDRAAHDALVGRIVRQIRDEPAVDLQRVHRELFQIQERGITGPEVIDGKPYTERGDLTKPLEHCVRMAHDRCDPQKPGGRPSAGSSSNQCVFVVQSTEDWIGTYRVRFSTSMARRRSSRCGARAIWNTWT